MRILTSLCLSVAFALPLGLVGPKAAGCDPLGNVQFVCNQVGPEDLVSVPGGNGWWLRETRRMARSG